jgi:Flp pilus assembly protein CpaB
MRRGRTLILLVLIVVVGLGVLYLFFNQLNTGPAPAATQTATKQVYYAAQNIPQGTVITQEMLSTFSIPPENVAEVMFETGEEGNLVGQTARYTLDQGTLITTSMVGSDPGELPGPPWAVQVPPGMVAVAIPTNRLATAAYGINDGAHVNVNVCMTFVDVDPAYQASLPNYLSSVQDIYFPTGGRPILTIDALTAELPARQGRTELDPTFQKPIYVVPSEAQRPRLVCQAVLQDVTVLNLGNFSLQTEPVTTTQDPNAPAQAPAPAEQAPDIITLMVSPQDSISLNYFVYSGAVFSMALRNPNDPSRIEAQSATLTSILTQYNISLPSKLPYAQQPRLDVLAPPLLPNDIITVQPQQ